MRAALLFFAATVCGINWLHADENVKVEIHGQGWSDIGRIVHVTDTLVTNVTGNWQQSAGAQFTAKAFIGDDWVGAFGFGGYQIYSALGRSGDAPLAKSVLQNFITESRMTYYHGGRENSNFNLTFGNFPFIYNNDTKNLGSYLLRGPVYPGFLTGGFKDFRVDSTKGNVLGFNAHQDIGNFSHDIVIANERELPPTGDWSASYLASYKAFGFLEIGGGVNFYRFLPNNKKLTDPSKDFYSSDSSFMNDHKPHHPYDFQYITREPVINGTDTTYDTTFYTHRGIKVMGRFSLDLKAMLGLDGLGANDLKWYGEAAVLGVKDYGSVYSNILERIPVMTGFNLPTWGLLDFFTVEVEYYGARYRNDLGKLGNFNTLGGTQLSATGNPPTIPSPIPVSYLNYETLDGASVKGTNLDVLDMTSDNWKWSLYLEKNVLNHVRFIGQVANDHFRPRPVMTAIKEIGGYAEAFSSLSDYYWMARVGYYF